jgi:DeoR family transcriptional regulator, suf operon transcriptional repressor
MLMKQLLDTSRGRIVTLLRHGPLTVDDIAARMGLTANAVRVQITGMERDGVVQRAGQRLGSTRPSNIFELTSEVEQLLSRAYIPFLTQLVRVLAGGLPQEQAEGFFRETGRGLVEEFARPNRVSGDLRTRIQIASDLLNNELGAITRVEENGSYVIRGLACPLAAITGKHPAVCQAMESLVSAIVEAPVSECCDRSERPRCCFEIAKG